MDRSIFFKHPTSFDIDICGSCNLSCPYCPEGQKLNKQPLKFMPYEDFIDIFQTLPEGITNIGLTNWSEPFLNKDIIKIIEYVKTNRPEVKIWVSSNGNAFRDNLATQTVLAGLDFLEITISGLSDEIYRKYHKHGKIDRVFQAIDEITRVKQKFHLSKPRLTINYLLFPYNIVDERTIEDTFAQQLSYRDQQKSIDAIRIVRGTILGTQAVLQEIRHRSPETYQLFKYTIHFKNLCLQLFLNPAVRADGSVFPCCITDYRDELVMGNLHENRFDDIWESEKYRSFRESFLRGENQICNTCFFTYSPAPLFDFKHFNLRVKTNMKLIIQINLKYIFLIDRFLFKSKLFQTWVSFRLKNKLKTI